MCWGRVDGKAVYRKNVLCAPYLCRHLVYKNVFLGAAVGGADMMGDDI